jgi:hypothetical protein
MQKVCSICNVNFEAKRKDSLYCSIKCKKSAEYQRRETFQKNCLYCSKQFETKRKDTEYCSSSCSNTSCKTHDNVELNCKQCNKQFTVKYIDRDKLFCSRSCATIYQNNIMYSSEQVRNKISETKKKQYDSGEFVHPFLGKKHSEEAKEKIGNTRKILEVSKGTNNPSYGKKGTLSPIYGIKRSEETKEKISEIKTNQWKDGKYNQVNFNTFYKKGFIISMKANMQIWYRSGFEKEIYEYLEKDNNIITFRPEPFIIKYHYSVEKQNRNYLPDVLCFYKNGDIKLVEFKPEYKLKEQKNIDKFQAAEKYCQEKGMIFEVWTEKSNPYLV